LPSLIVLLMTSQRSAPHFPLCRSGGKGNCVALRRTPPHRADAPFARSLTAATPSLINAELNHALLYDPAYRAAAKPCEELSVAALADAVATLRAAAVVELQAAYAKRADLRALPPAVVSAARRAAEAAGAHPAVRAAMRDAKCHEAALIYTVRLVLVVLVVLVAVVLVVLVVVLVLVVLLVVVLVVVLVLVLVLALVLTVAPQHHLDAAGREEARELLTLPLLPVERSAEQHQAALARLAPYDAAAAHAKVRTMLLLLLLLRACRCSCWRWCPCCCCCV